MNDMYVNIKSKSEKSVTEDEITVRITVGEVENGFIVTKNISGRRPVKPGTTENMSSDGTEYFDEGKTYITTTNPLEGDGEDEIKLPNVKGLMDQYNSGKISV